MDGFKGIDKLKYTIKTILPQVYTDALSFQELLGKVVKLLNDLIENNTKLKTCVLV